MSKELIRPSQFAKADTALLAEQTLQLTLNDEQRQELADLYTGIFETLQPGKLITGKAVRIDSDGVLVDINYKSDGLIPRYEFPEHELKNFKVWR